MHGHDNTMSRTLWFTHQVNIKSYDEFLERPGELALSVVLEEERHDHAALPCDVHVVFVWFLQRNEVLWVPIV